MRMLIRMLLCCLVLLAGGAASAATLGVVSDFQSGADGWVSGSASPNPPVVIPDGGPAGAGDAFLRLSTSGNPGGAGSKLAVFNRTGDWTGNYTAAGIGAIEFDVTNLGDTAVTLRILLGPPQAQAASNAAVALDALADWQRVRIPILATDLVGADPAAILANVFEIRLMHNPTATTSDAAPAISALIGIDNVTAAPIPEPSTALLLLAGLVGIAGARRRSAG